MPAYNKVQKKGRMYFIAVPINYITALKIRPADYFEITLEQDGVIKMKHISSAHQAKYNNLSDNDIQYVAAGK